jgi:hypothetical protein
MQHESSPSLRIWLILSAKRSQPKKAIAISKFAYLKKSRDMTNNNDDGIDFLITWKHSGKSSIISDRDVDALTQRRPGQSRTWLNKHTGMFEEPIRIEPLPRETLTRQQ